MMLMGWYCTYLLINMKFGAELTPEDCLPTNEEATAVVVAHANTNSIEDRILHPKS